MDPEPQMILQSLKQLAQIEPRREAAERALAHARKRIPSPAAEPPSPMLISTPRKSFFRRKNMLPRMAAIILGGAALIAVVVALTSLDGQ